MNNTFLIRIEFESRKPLMYPFCGNSMSLACESARSFMKCAAIRRPIKAEIWRVNALVLSTVVTFEG